MLKTSLFLFFLAMILLADTFTNAIAAENLEMIWHFDEGSGEVCKEANGTGNDAVFTGAGKKNIKWGEGKWEKALLFSGNIGKGQWVEVPHSPDVDIRDAITMEAWVFPTNIPSTNGN